MDGENITLLGSIRADKIHLLNPDRDTYQPSNAVNALAVILQTEEIDYLIHGFSTGEFYNPGSQQCTISMITSGSDIIGIADYIMKQLNFISAEWRWSSTDFGAGGITIDASETLTELAHRSKPEFREGMAHLYERSNTIQIYGDHALIDRLIS